MNSVIVTLHWCLAVEKSGLPWVAGGPLVHALRCPPCCHAEPVCCPSQLHYNSCKQQTISIKNRIGNHSVHNLIGFNYWQDTWFLNYPFIDQYTPSILNKQTKPFSVIFIWKFVKKNVKLITDPSILLAWKLDIDLNCKWWTLEDMKWSENRLENEVVTCGTPTHLWCIPLVILDHWSQIRYH